MATKKKLLQAAAGSAGGAGLDVEDVFSTYLFKPNTSGTYPIVNNIDLDAEGGMVWMKRRDASGIHMVHDTERWGASNGGYLRTDNTNSSASTAFFSSFNSDGFTPQDLINQEMASWTFRKAPKFFDVVTYTGNGATHRDVPHNLGSAPGWVITKRIDAADNWMVYSKASVNEYKLHWLNTTDATHVNYNPSNSNYNWTDSVFYASSQYSFANTNANGVEYVSYLFANHDGDGEFGPDGDADIIKCGSYTGNGSAGHFIDLGFEPQWLIIKRADAAASWEMLDVMRGLPAGGEGSYLRANKTNAEATSSNHSVAPSPTGFTINSTSNINGNNDLFIYMAIRRGTKVPESADEVFDIDAVNSSEPYFTSGFPIDMAFYKSTSGSSGYVSSRLTGLTEGELDTTAAFGGATAVGYDKMTGFLDSAGNPGANYYAWMWKRAPNFFDVVAYSGNSTSGRTVSHNLGVAPEMIWVKNRDNANDWNVWHSAFTATQSLRLNKSGTVENNSWFTASPTDQAFFTNSYQGINASGYDYISYLFSSLDGISKVGSYAGNDGTQTIDCGFTTGARFILIKKTDGSDWFVWDTERGINVASDPYLTLNTTDEEESGQDEIDAHASGFIINSPGGSGDAEINKSGKTYIFYAIA